MRPACRVATRPAPRPLRWLACGCMVGMLAAGAGRAGPEVGAPQGAVLDIGARIAEAQRALEAWQIDEAQAIAAELQATLPDVPPVQAVVGAVKFHQGDYDGALRLLQRAAEGGVVSPLLELAESTRQETEGFVARASAHFVVRTPPGKDELLADIALWALEKAYEEVSAAFDYHPAHKIPVDILHDAKGLASVSSLTVKEIQTSGTIALCKYNRLMITSPKALARGYSWLDTLAHELVHLVISEKSANTVPIWLHEGLAKYAESLWRGTPGLALEPASENLLAAALRQDKLITFEQMHPSMAKLPSQKDTALAFAEVFTVIEFLHRERAKDPARPFGVTNTLLERLRAGDPMDSALQASVGTDLAGMQKAWTRYLKKRAFRLQPGAEPRKLTFVKDPRRGNSDADALEEEAALAEAGGRAGKRYVRLGNLLRQRGRLRAAALEYEQASARMEHVSPALMNRLAGLYLELGESERARGFLERSVKAAPDDPQTHILLGRAALREGRDADARAHYERATWENPFNPEIHAALFRIAERSGDAAAKERATQALRLLSGHAQAHPGADQPFRPLPKAPFGTLSVTSSPWGEVFIDGIAAGVTTPLVDLPLVPGRHRVRVEDRASGAIASVEVEIAASEAARLTLTLAPASEAERERLYALERPALPPPPPGAGADAGDAARADGEDE